MLVRFTTLFRSLNRDELILEGVNGSLEPLMVLCIQCVYVQGMIVIHQIHDLLIVELRLLCKDKPVIGIGEHPHDTIIMIVEGHCDGLLPMKHL